MTQFSIFKSEISLFKVSFRSKSFREYMSLRIFISALVKVGIQVYDVESMAIPSRSIIVETLT